MIDLYERLKEITLRVCQDYIDEKPTSHDEYVAQIIQAFIDEGWHEPVTYDMVSKVAKELQETIDNAPKHPATYMQGPFWLSLFEKELNALRKELGTTPSDQDWEYMKAAERAAGIKDE